MRSSFFVALFICAAFLAGAPSPAMADQPPVQTALLSRLAVGGYDPVAYFSQGRPVRGAAAHRLTHQGYEYRFVSAQNLATFRAAPERYLPQFGGYCAWAVANGYTAPGNPLNWRIVDGRLYLNYNAEIQSRWERDIPGFIRAANANWPGVLRR
ncbi:MAG: YHS domain-containing protein [Hyphomonadaceae bacterium]|nr:YHS domain-containing protein [Hyphomonadaceae bacterium]MBX3511429.1 YHS domain-containing protein [Hyphomonadaceae bacterium]